jgi:hypothetical protein
MFFAASLIINQINKVQWVDFKLENVLVSLHSLKTMGLGSIIFKEWRVTRTFPYTYFAINHQMFNACIFFYNRMENSKFMSQRMLTYTLEVVFFIYDL